MQHNVQPITHARVQPTDEQAAAQRSVDRAFPAVAQFLASADAPLMRVDAPQVSGPRIRTIRLLDTPGATLAVTCPDWCESDHYEDITHGTFLEDFAHRGTEEALHVDMGDGTAEDVLMCEFTQYPFGGDLREPTVLMWPTLGMSEAHLDPEHLCALAGQLREYARALDQMTARLENIREQATAARRADHEGRWTR